MRDIMSKQKIIFKNEKELENAILKEKKKGVSDLEIGKKYGVSFKYIERLITRSQGLNISNLKTFKKIKLLQPKDFQEEKSTIWSFKQRGNWATHSGEYRGNWSPYIPRNIILKYSKPGEMVVDYFCGAGTTAIECKLLGRKCIAIDINEEAIKLAQSKLDFDIFSPQLSFINQEELCQFYNPELIVGDARDLSFLQDESIDLICAHPPYANIIYYTDSKKGDLSFYDINDFLREMKQVARESFRVLKPGKQCAILIGDTRRKKHVIPLGYKLINIYLEAGFTLKELVIKRQHNCKTTGFWYANSIKYNFLLLAHEYLPIFEKPEKKISFSVKDREMDYTLVAPTLDKSLVMRRLNELETTTVWIFPEKNLEKCLNKNVIERYSKKGNYSSIDIVTNYKNEVKISKDNLQKDKDLVFIKSSFLNTNRSFSNIECYLKQTKDLIDQELGTLNKGGFLVIQTKDVRLDNGYIEPLAKRLVDMLVQNNLWLKEIIVVTSENQNFNIDKHVGNLVINHSYILVYKKIESE